MTTKQLFGLRVKSLRENRRWTQEVLAEKMNINPNYLSSIERGKENPTFDMLIKLSDALEIDMWELFDFKQEVSEDELRGMLTDFAQEIDKDRLKLAVKALRAITR